MLYPLVANVFNGVKTGALSKARCANKIHYSSTFVSDHELIGRMFVWSKQSAKNKFHCSRVWVELKAGVLIVSIHKS